MIAISNKAESPTSDQMPAPDRVGPIVEAVIRRTSEKTELVLSSGRGVLCGFVLVRFLSLAREDSTGFYAKALIALPALAVGMVLSAWIARRALHRSVTAPLLVLSVVLDAAVCFGALLPNVMEPWASYRGLLHTPDVAILPVLCVMAGLRLSLGTALVGSAFNAASLGVLLALDLERNAESVIYRGHELALIAAYMAGASIVGLVIAVRTKRVAQRGARESIRAELLQRSLSLVMQDHHDVRSLLSSAQLNGDMLLRELGSHTSSRLATTAQNLKRDLAEVARFVTGARERAYVELSVLADSEPVDVRRVVERVAVVLERFPGVSFELAHSERSPQVRIVGGERGLERVLVNLLVNSCEGDGRRGAQSVRLETICEAGGVVRIDVTDDGPGFPQSLLDAPVERFATSKLGSSGLGLYLIKAVVEASDGTVVLANGENGGAKVSVRLRPDGTFKAPIAFV